MDAGNGMQEDACTPVCANDGLRRHRYLTFNDRQLFHSGNKQVSAIGNRYIHRILIASACLVNFQCTSQFLVTAAAENDQAVGGDAGSSKSEYSSSSNASNWQDITCQVICALR